MQMILRAPNMLSIRRQSELTKRWSTGELVGFRDTVGGRVTGATVDGIVGSSGAPIFDVHGQIVTMVAVGTSGLPDNFAYVGDETGSQLRPQVLSTACGSLRRILDQ